MKIICIVKFVPDVDNIRYDFENNTLDRSRVRLILNPDDVCAVSVAFQIKDRNLDTSIEVVTMAPVSVKTYMEDLIRLGADQATILCDKAFAGSDTYATSKVLAAYLEKQPYDLILTGTHAIDGDTSHIPAQVGAWLDLDQISGVTWVDTEGIDKRKAYFKVDKENEVIDFEVKLPAILSLSRESSYKLPYIKRTEIDRDVSQSLTFLNKEDLNISECETGDYGSLTKVVATHTREYQKKECHFVRADEEGIETIFRFLEHKGFIE